MQGGYRSAAFSSSPGPKGFRLGLGWQDAISASKNCLKMTAGKRIKTIMPLSSSRFKKRFLLPEKTRLGWN